MPIPDYQEVMLPLVKLVESVGDKEISKRVLVDRLAQHFDLTDAERQELLPSGGQTRFDSRVGWAATYLKQAGLLVSPKRGTYHITPRGREVLARNLPAIDNGILSEFDEFQAFKSRKRPAEDAEPVAIAGAEKTPEEALEDAYDSIRDELASQILEKLRASSPAFFERLVVDLLVRMGYGGSLTDAGKAVGRSGDGGIDGIIKEDKLGLDVIYIQAKRWNGNSIGRPDVQQFAGALQGRRANKGIFITTSKFTNEAREYVQNISSKIVLIDGEELAQLMIDHGVGVSTVTTYEIKRMDSDYFNEDL